VDPAVGVEEGEAFEGVSEEARVDGAEREGPGCALAWLMVRYSIAIRTRVGGQNKVDAQDNADARYNVDTQNDVDAQYNVDAQYSIDA
jgi:hypothetical protein